MAAENINIIVPSQGGLNSDDDLIILPVNDSRHRENVVISDDYNFSVITNVRGNLLKDNNTSFSYPSGDLRVIGYVENKEENAGIFFVYSSAGEHSIIQYRSNTDTLEYILRGGTSVVAPIGIDDILNLSLDNFVDVGIIGSEDQKYLVWTDGFNEPRIINIDGAINFTSGTPTLYSSIDANIIRFYKEPLLNPLSVEYHTLTSNSNEVRGKIWQFAIRKKFIDNTYSVLSPYSEIAIPQEEETAYGDFVRVNVNKWIEICFLNPNDNLVESYQLFYRVCDVGSESVGYWYKSNLNQVIVGSNVCFYFYNDGDAIIVDQTEVNRIYDYVPDLADYLYIIDSNRIVFGGITEGYDNIPNGDLSINLEHEYAEAENDGFVSKFYELVGNGSTSGNISCLKDVPKSYHYSLVLGAQGVDVSETYGKTSAEVAELMADRVNDLTDWIGNYSAGNTYFTVTNNTGSTVTVYMYIVEPHSTYSSFKCGSIQYFGLIYYKDGKPWYVQTDNSFNVQIPYEIESYSLLYSGTHANTDNSATFDSGSTSLTPDAYIGKGILNIADASWGVITGNTSQYIYTTLKGGTDNDFDIGDVVIVMEFSWALNYYNKIKWSINHLPPQGSTHYQWAYLGSNIERYNYFYMWGGLFPSFNDMYVDGQYIVIKKSIITNFVDAFGGTIDYGFDIQKGDRFRVVGLCSDIKFGILLADEIIDLEIIASDDTVFKIDYNSSIAIASYNIGIVYRPRQVSEENGIYQAVSPIFEIYDDGGIKRHRGDLQDQTSLLDATGYFNPYFADTFLQRKTFVNNNNSGNYNALRGYNHIMGWMENMAVSILYDSTITSFGQSNVKNELAKTNYYNKIRWGGKYLEDSGANYMCSFDYIDEKQLDDRNGKINKIQQIGDVLKVYQQRMVNSFYLKTTSSTSADGSQTYVFSDNVMSDARQSVFEYGCSHYTSFIKTVREAYYFDIINSVVIKDTPGGPVVISDQKMHSYFKAKSMEVLEYGIDNVLILGGYDEDLDMYLITFYDPDNPTESINETLGYYIPADRWISFYSYLPEYYGKISGFTALTFLDGKLYVQNSNPIRNNFFGVQYSSLVDIHSNKNPNEVKIYDSISINSTNQWSPNEDGDIEITLPELMQSRLVDGKFKIHEGVYLSEFLRDAIVKDGVGGTTFDKRQLQYGRFLRGYEIRVRLKNDDTEESNLRLVSIKSNFSQ